MWLVYYTPVGIPTLHFDMAFSHEEMLATAKSRLHSSTSTLHHVLGPGGQTVTAEHVAMFFAAEASAKSARAGSITSHPPPAGGAPF